MTRKQRRLFFIVIIGATLSFAVGLTLFALSSKITAFYTPATLAESDVAPGQRFRLGGLVMEGSVKRGQGLLIEFTVTDTLKTLNVEYTGALPDLFREGQGVVAEGILQPNGLFIADSVLAKHDETYMPKEVSDTMKDLGVWKDEGQDKGNSPAPSYYQGAPK
jgi:cytochrome c-type biogenesis protein CcmE